jgi:hypothetical protein
MSTQGPLLFAAQEFPLRERLDDRSHGFHIQPHPSLARTLHRGKGFFLERDGLPPSTKKSGSCNRSLLVCRAALNSAMRSYQTSIAQGALWQLSQWSISSKSASVAVKSGIWWRQTFCNPPGRASPGIAIFRMPKSPTPQARKCRGQAMREGMRGSHLCILLHSVKWVPSRYLIYAMQRLYVDSCVSLRQHSTAGSISRVPL